MTLPSMPALLKPSATAQRSIRKPISAAATVALAGTLLAACGSSGEQETYELH